MRKFALMAAAAAAVVAGGSMVKADFVVSHTRAVGAITIAGNSYDTITWSVVNNGLNGTGGGLGSVDVAFLDPQSGMPIGLNKANHPDIYGANANTVANDSYLVAGTAGAPGQSVLKLSGGTYTVDQQSSTDTFVGPYVANQLVAGIAGGMLFTSPLDISTTDGFGAPFTFARIVVPTGDPVELLAAGAGHTAAGVPTTWEPLASAFGEDPSDSAGALVPISATIIDGTVNTPEPASLSIFGIMAAGLLARRRHA